MGFEMTKRVELTIILWGLLIVNNWMLASRQIENGIKVSGLCLSFLFVVWWISCQVQSKKIGRTMLIVAINLLVGWLVLLPIGGLGITSYIINLIVLPTALLRLMYLHRILVVPIAIICYGGLILLWWRLMRGQMLTRLHSQYDNNLMTIQLGRRFNSLIILSMIELLLMYLCSEWLVNINDALAGFLLLLLGTLLLASWVSLLIMSYFELSLVAKANWLINISLTSLCGLMVLGWTVQLNDVNDIKQPIVISHRGVDGNNGVQNTSQSLRRTVIKHPAAIEMDIQATKDNAFVCFHDANLDHLAHRHTTVAKLGFNKLRRIKLSENGFTTTMTPFEQYLQFSIRHRQPLIVEIKPQKIDPVKVANTFKLKYAHQLDQQRIRIHSVDDTIINQLHRHDPNLIVGLIQPFVVSRLTNKKVNFYSLNYHTVNQQNVNWLHQHHQKVYVWTVDSPAVADRMSQLGVDGIITNRLSLIRAKMMSHTSVITRVENILWQLI